MTPRQVCDSEFRAAAALTACERIAALVGALVVSTALLGVFLALS